MHWCQDPSVPLRCTRDDAVRGAIRIPSGMAGCQNRGLCYNQRKSRVGERMREIKTAEELALLRQDPAGSYVLTADIDMAGSSWRPVDFSGTLDGAGHTVFNLKTEKVAGRESTGFFGCLQGTVCNLHIRQAEICASGTRHAGVLAGVIQGKAENCTVTGQICNCTGACVGALAGKVTGICLGGDAVTAQAGPHTQSGLCADVEMAGKAALVGELGIDAVVTGLWRDRTYSTRRLSKVLQERRQKAVDYMYAMAKVRWKIDQDRLIYIKNRTKCVQYQCYERGVVYQGIPYAHSGGGLARFLFAMQSETDGVYTAKPNLKNGEYYVGEVAESLASEGIQVKDNYGFTQYMGNDCSSAVSWAWRQISSVDIAEGGCYGRYSGNMIPTEENEKKHGILPVGDFYACSEDTRIVVEQMGEEALYEAYAKALSGDALSGFDDGGHVLMFGFDPVVVRNGAGKIDPDRSFAVTIEQGPGLFDCKDQDQRFVGPLPSTWRVDYRYSFRNLARMNYYSEIKEKRKQCGCDHIYLPITMQALRTERTPAVTPRIWMDGSTVFSNFYITATQMGEHTIHTQISHDWHIYRQFPVTSVDLAKTHELPLGSYTAKIHLSNGQVEEVAFSVCK